MPRGYNLLLSVQFGVERIFFSLSPGSITYVLSFYVVLLVLLKCNAPLQNTLGWLSRLVPQRHSADSEGRSVSVNSHPHSLPPPPRCIQQRGEMNLKDLPERHSNAAGATGRYAAANTPGQGLSCRPSLSRGRGWGQFFCSYQGKKKNCSTPSLLDLQR